MNFYENVVGLSALFSRVENLSASILRFAELIVSLSEIQELESNINLGWDVPSAWFGLESCLEDEVKSQVLRLIYQRRNWFIGSVAHARPRLKWQAVLDITIRLPCTVLS